MSIEILEPAPNATVTLTDGKLDVKVQNGTCDEVLGKLSPATTFTPLTFTVVSNGPPQTVRVSGLTAGTWVLKVKYGPKEYSEELTLLASNMPGGLPDPPA